jgi:hypothetical protein
MVPSLCQLQEQINSITRADINVWEPMPTFSGTVSTNPDIWIGVVPRPFEATHLRLSCASNSGVSLNWGLDIGEADVTLAEGTWTYAAGVYSILIPFSAWNTDLSSATLPAGASVRMTTQTSGAYGSTMVGLQVAFLGRWLS